MSELMTWRRIPPGATLEVSLTPAAGEFSATGQVFTFSPTNPPDQEWLDAEVHPGPKQFRIGKASDYIVDLLVTFVSPARTTATVSVSVIKSDGTTYGRPRTATLAGKNGDAPETVSIVLITQ
jgi:hypothetical protein